MQTLIGSRAAKIWYPDFRKTNDIDWLCDEEKEPYNGVFGRHEYHYARTPVLRELLESSGTVMPARLLYTLKMSHIFWDIHWHKNAADILFFQMKDLKLHQKWFDKLYSTWEEIHGKKRAYLQKSNEDFFKDNVKRLYVHDSIHAAMAYYDEPMYFRVKKDKDKAAISHSLFLDLSYLDQLRLAREELYVTALERYMIPADMNYNPWQAYRFAMRQLVTSMSKGWFPKFIMENQVDLYMPEIDYVARFERNQYKLEKI